jgi:hypothetical protein
MRRIIFLAIILVILSDITHQTEFQQQNVPKLRSFSIKSLKKLRELRRDFEIKRKLLEELEKKELALKNKQLLEQYEERKRFFNFLCSATLAQVSSVTFTRIVCFKFKKYFLLITYK